MERRYAGGNKLARTKSESVDTPTSPARSTRSRADESFVSPTRVSFDETSNGTDVRRRSSATSRRSVLPSLVPRTTLAERTQGEFIVTGPDETTQLRLSHEPFVQPGYIDLNPSYEQPANAKPVWSLAKPLPRVVRPGMVPTKAKLLENHASAQLPAENSQKLGLDIDPNDIERGQIQKFADPRKISAQVEDARLQRESNIMNKILSGGAGSSRLSRTSSMRGRQPSEWLSPNAAKLSSVEEGEDQHQPPSEEPPQDLREDNFTIGSLDFDHEALPEDLHPLVQGLIEEEGFATMSGIYISGGVSGAHLNPSITIMLWFYRGFSKRKMPEYFIAQFVGVFCAALTAYGIYYQSIQHYLSIDTNTDTGIINSFVTNQREAWIGPATAFFNEFLGTIVLTTTILALGDDQNAPPGAGMNSLIIGLVITCLMISFAYQTGAAFNPTRDFGPRLAPLALGYGRDLLSNPYWFYGPWVGTISGAFAGGFLYDFMVFTGGESPVNYPLERTQRAMRKSRMKWKRRLHLREKVKA
ncbi:uncharacterized protein N7518_000989 [Penicillium psychrosexuale]|uniref:uncharacterized protein n=1 Tax=Penicillium psychrosexuale TaxID=1002107 RepID=UPI002545B8CD|nr:uncharacterized protein N7518_000989 [Penicillium psychrosexuale]KAJ5804686.1 hypothetical protein N7518_000989 [Penicillium psychrosexuale]